MLAANPNRARLFHSESLASEDIYESFLRLLWKGNYFVQEKSSKKPSHSSRAIPAAICLSTLLKEPVARSSFARADGIKLSIPLISPAQTQQSILVIGVVVLTFKNFLAKEEFGAQMVDLGLLQIVESLTTQAWSDGDLLDSLNQLEEGLRKNVKKLSSFEKYKQEILLGYLDWSSAHKDALFWRENITSFEESDFQILRVLITILDSSSEPRTLAVTCFDLSQFIQCHPAGWIIATDLRAKERVMKLVNHGNAEVKKNALPGIQRLLLGAKNARFPQAQSG